MPRLRISWIGVALALALGAAGCSGKGLPVQQPFAAPDAVGPLPAGVLPVPSSLPKTASLPPGELDRYREATNYASVVPPQHFNNGTFSPQWNPPGQAELGDAAYGAYKFSNMNEYSGIGRIKLGWVTPPQDNANLWVGLSNFSRDRWDWFNLIGGEAVSVASLAPYTSPGGDLYAVVLLLGSQPAQLQWILAGENLPPLLSVTTDLPANPLARIAPLTVNFDASMSTSKGGVIVGYDFDWQGDGTWEVTGDSDGKANHTYPAGTYSAKVRAVDERDVTAVYTLDFIAIDPSNQAPVAEFTPPSTLGQAPLSVQFDPAASSDSDGAIIKYEWDFNNDGAYDLTTTTPDAITHTFGIFGVSQITLRVTDNYLATDTVTHDVECINGWRQYIANPDIRIEEQLSVAAIGAGNDARAWVAYQDFNATDLTVQHALTATGSTWSAPVHPVGGADEKGFDPSIIASVDGLPLIAYGVHEPSSTNYDLYTVHAMDDSGTAWFAPVTVSLDDNVGRDHSLLVLNSVPAIAAIGDSGFYSTSRILYYQCLDGNGGSWSAARTAVPAAAQQRLHDVSLGKAGSAGLKRPYLAYLQDSGIGGMDLRTVKGGNIDGTSWDAPVILGSISVFDTFTMFVDGNPAVLAGNPNQGGQLWFARADNADGSAFAGGMAPIGGGGYGNMVLFGGKPAACYYDYEGSELWFVTASDTQGSSWNVPYQVDMTGAVGLYCQLVPIGGSVMIVYYDQTNKRLKCAYFELT